MLDLGELKTELGISSSATADDALLVELEARAVETIEHATGRYFGPVTGREFIGPGDDSNELHLPERALRIVSVHERSCPGEAWTKLDVDEYELRDFRLFRTNGSSWLSDLEYRVLFDFGYEENEEPGDVRQLIADLVRLRFERRKLNPALQSERRGEQSYTIRIPTGGEDELELIPGARQTVRRWKLPVA